MNIEHSNQFTNTCNHPCIFNTGMEKWPALTKWNLDFFKKKFSNVKATINYNLPEQQSPYLYTEQPHSKQMSLSKCIDFIYANDRCYIAQHEIKDFVGLEQDFNFLDIIPTLDHNKPIYTNLWVGKNTRSGLHYDYNDNFLVQISGHKKVFLAAPDDIKYLYPLADNFTKTQVNPMDPDLKKFPKLKNATIFTGEINPGEILFIPKGWFHYIYSPKESISLNCWYGDSLTKIEHLQSFYRSGWRTWLQFSKDFIWHGLLKQSSKSRLFCSPPLGKLFYNKLFSL